MAVKEVGKEASQSDGELYFQTYQKLLKQKEQIDRDLFKLQKDFSKKISKQGGIVADRKTYVPRLNNTTTLVEAIRKCMIPKREMTMIDIIGSLEKKGLYHTSSKYFYTMVNNKIHQDEDIKRIGRGVFILRPRKRVRKVAVA